MTTSTSAAAPKSRRAADEWSEEGLLEKWHDACVSVFLADDDAKEQAALEAFFKGRCAKSAITFQFVPLLKLLRVIRTKNLERNARLDALEARLAGLESKPHVKYCGTYKAAATYEPGDAVTHHGALWIAKVQTVGEPSKDFVAWQLAVKRGAA